MSWLLNGLGGWQALTILIVIYHMLLSIFGTEKKDRRYHSIESGIWFIIYLLLWPIEL